jgi:hypothetical protein
MSNDRRKPDSDLFDRQAASVLLTAIVAFLKEHGISQKLISECAQGHGPRQKAPNRLREYRKLMRAYEDMGMVMSAWFSLPKFLDRDGQPVPLSVRRGNHSIRNLLRSSRANIPVTLAVNLLRRSPSVRLDAEGNFNALNRVFVLPGFGVPRAALVIDRYLETLRQNSSAQKSGTTLLLERNCHVPHVDLRRITPILRDIKGRGTAFMDSVDGDIEAHRARRPSRKGIGELGVLVFAWTRASGSRRSRSTQIDP